MDLSSPTTPASLYSSSDYKSKPWGMAAADELTKLYWSNGSTLCFATYNQLHSGSPSVSTLSITTVVGTTSAAVSMVGLAYDPVHHELLGSSNGPTKALYVINTSTGVSTLKYTFSAGIDFGGIDCSTDGSIYGVADVYSTTAAKGLYVISSGTPGSSLIPYPPTEYDIDGMAVGGGKAYLVTDGPSKLQPSIYIYDIANNVYLESIPSPFLFPAAFAGAAYAPALASDIKSLTGTITLSDTAFGSDVRRYISYSVKQGSAVLWTGRIAVAAQTSAYWIPIKSSATGAAVIHWDGESFLTEQQSVTLTGSNVTGGSVTLRNGDCDGSGEVDAADIDETLAVFGFLWPGTVAQDCDASSEVDAADIDVIVANFGQQDE